MAAVVTAPLEHSGKALKRKIYELRKFFFIKINYLIIFIYNNRKNRIGSGNRRRLDDQKYFGAPDKKKIKKFAILRCAGDSGRYEKTFENFDPFLKEVGQFWFDFFLHLSNILNIFRFLIFRFRGREIPTPGSSLTHPQRPVAMIAFNSLNIYRICVFAALTLRTWRNFFSRITVSATSSIQWNDLKMD